MQGRFTTQEDSHKLFYPICPSFSKRHFDSAQGLGYPEIREVNPDWIINRGLHAGVTEDAFMSCEPNNFSVVRILVCDAHLAGNDRIKLSYVPENAQLADGGQAPAVLIDVRNLLPLVPHVAGNLSKTERSLIGSELRLFPTCNGRCVYLQTRSL